MALNVNIQTSYTLPEIGTLYHFVDEVKPEDRRERRLVQINKEVDELTQDLLHPCFDMGMLRGRISLRKIAEFLKATIEELPEKKGRYVLRKGNERISKEDFSAQDLQQGVICYEDIRGYKFLIAEVLDEGSIYKIIDPKNTDEVDEEIERLIEERTTGTIEIWDGGSLVERSHLRNGMFVGVREAWYPNGTLRERQHFSCGAIHGPVEKWRKDGTRSQLHNYHYGSFVSLDLFDEDGVACDHTNFHSKWGIE